MSMFESLESRRLMSASLVDGTLIIEGTPGDDRIAVETAQASITPERSIGVNLNGQFSSYPLADVTGITIYARGGNDEVIVQGQDFHGNYAPITVPVLIRGGPGNDTLHAGDGNDTLYGGAGSDVLLGGNGDDTLRGRAGADSLVGGGGTDSFGGGIGLDVAVDADAAAGDQVRTSVEWQGSIQYAETLRNDAGGYGGDTTGWRIIREQDGQSVEVDVTQVRQDALAHVGQRVCLVGQLTERNYLERGKVLVLVVEQLLPA